MTTEKIKKRISEVLKRIRKEEKLTQRQMAEVIGVSKDAICSWELGRNQPSGVVLLEIMARFNLDRNDFVDDSSEKNTENEKLKDKVSKMEKALINKGILTAG